MAFINFQPKDYFNTKLYTGTGSSNDVTGVGFQPDWVWIKKRNATGQHQLFNAVRGVTKRVYSDSTDAESTSATTLTAFGTDGFTVGSNSGINGSSDTIVSWNWLANGAGSSNTDGSITSTVSANTTSGFSIVTYTSGGGSGTVGHGLNSVPKVMFYKPLSTSGGWDVYHYNLGISLRLNLHNDAAESSGYFQTLPTNSVFTEPNLYSGQSVIMYCFAEKKGFSKFGKYFGNSNADGTFVYTGFKPSMVIVKDRDVNQWQMFDSKRGRNGLMGFLYPDSAETESSSVPMDILSNGFKFRDASVARNGSGEQYLYMAFAEEPLVSSNGVPNTAR
jgi:hypothetical protein